MTLLKNFVFEQVLFSLACICVCVCVSLYPDYLKKVLNRIGWNLEGRFIMIKNRLLTKMSLIGPLERKLWTISFFFNYVRLGVKCTAQLIDFRWMWHNMILSVFDKQKDWLRVKNKTDGWPHFITFEVFTLKQWIVSMTIYGKCKQFFPYLWYFFLRYYFPFYNLRDDRLYNW